MYFAGWEISPIERSVMLKNGGNILLSYFHTINNKNYFGQYCNDLDDFTTKFNPLLKLCGKGGWIGRRHHIILHISLFCNDCFNYGKHGECPYYGTGVSPATAACRNFVAKIV